VVGKTSARFVILRIHRQGAGDIPETPRPCPDQGGAPYAGTISGIGNWMADEILWRAGIHPKQAAGSLEGAQIKALYHEIRWVCREALRIIGKDFSDPPDSWLFPHRWQKGGTCPAPAQNFSTPPSWSYNLLVTGKTEIEIAAKQHVDRIERTASLFPL